jgi:hypothetical protein
MKSSVCALLLSAVLAASCGRGRGKPPPALLPAGWQDLQPRTVCLDVRQSFQETAETFSLPVEALVRQTLQGLRLEVVSEGQECDVDLLVQLMGQPLAAEYRSILTSGYNHCYTGARIGGEVRLTRSDRAPLSLALDESRECPSSISDCASMPEQAPFDDLWRGAVMGALLDLWGPQALDAAFAAREESERLATVGLGRKFGMVSVPMLIHGLADRSASVRSSAADCLQYLGEGAEEAVPALINLLRDEKVYVSSNATDALHAITGQDFGADQAQWRRWVAEGKPTPTPWTSWEGVVMMPGARWADESGTMRAFTVDVSCEEAMAFYGAQEVPAPEGMEPPAGAQAVWVASGAGAVQLSFHDSTVRATQPRCTVQFWLNTP